MRGDSMSSLCLAVAILLAAPGPMAPCAEPSPGELRAVLAERVAALRIQTEFPSEPPPRENSDYAPRADGRGASVAAGGDGFAAPLLWASLAVFFVVLLLALRDSLRRPDRAAKGKRASRPDRAGPPAARLVVAQQESDALAARGDYAEAMHLLLLRSVEEMRRRLGAPIAASLTSREIHQRSALDDEARGHFGDIIERVEISWFGSHLPGADEYARCRESYAALAAILGRGRPV